MATFYDGRALAASQQRRFNNFRRSARLAHQQMAEEMQKEAVDLSHGGISSAELAAMGHPYGRGRGRSTYNYGANKSASRGSGKVRIAARGAAPLLPINRQTGKLASSWRLFRRFKGDGGQQVDLQNISPESKFVLNPGGTKRMVARGFWVEMRKRWRPRNKRLIAELRTLGKRIYSAA